MNKSGMKETEKRFGTVLADAVRHVLMHNMWMKVLAVLISIILWAGLISQDESLTRDKTFNNVNVSVSGTDTMHRNGYIVVSNMEEMLKNVSLTAAVPQKEYETVEASAYNLRVDLSRINGIGKQELKILSSNSSIYGRVLSTTPSSLQVEVEDYISRQRIPVSVSVGTVPDEWYLSTPSVDPTVITVAGPKSVVETISRARAYLDTSTIEWEEGPIYTSGGFELYNRAGEPVSNSLMQVTSDSVIIDSVLVDANILPTRTFTAADLIKTAGKVKSGYEIKEIRISPETVKIAAPQDVLEQMTEIALDSRTVNVKNLTETTTFRLKVQKPSEDAFLYNDTVTVTVEIGPKE